MYSSVEYEHLVNDVNIRYLNSLVERNPGLAEAAVSLHQSGQIPPNTYLFDLDAHRKNARSIVSEANKYGVSLYYMSKQVGRNPLIVQGVLSEGFRGVVAVEVQCAKTLYRYGIRIAHVGHLSQPPVHDIDYVLSMDPEVWTVYSYENAKVLSDKAQRKGRVQNVLVQPVGKDDLFFETMSGGIPEDAIVETVDRINSDLPGVKVVGVTSFPCLLYDVGLHKVRPISNFHTVVNAAKTLKETLGQEITQINLPGNNHTSTMKTIAEGGGTHAEPGTGVSGANSEHVFEQQPEIPAYVYVTEVSHWLGDRLFAQGGGTAFPGGGWGIYPDGKLWVGGNGIQFGARIGDSLESVASNRVKAKYPGTDPFNYNLTLYHEGKPFKVGDTVLYGFDVPQVFTTRAWHAVVGGVSENDPKLLGIFDQGNNLVDRHGHLQGERAVVDLLAKIA
jgi:predicted amino acid racemase